VLTESRQYRSCCFPDNHIQAGKATLMGGEVLMAMERVEKLRGHASHRLAIKG
jgi:hypothetical protein